MNSNLRWLRDKIKMQNLQGIIISNPRNIKYLIGIEAEGILLITPKENIYITDGRYVENVNKTLTIDDEIIVYDMKNLTKDDYENFFLFCENVGFEEEYVTYAKYKDFMHRYKINSLNETEGIIEKQRMIKDPGEIELIKKACKITDDCFKYLLDYIKIGKTEKEIAFEIQKYFKTHGAEKEAFDTIVASGPNSSKPHAVPTDRKITYGDSITIDMGCVYEGYCSDMTRTIFMGEPNEKVKKVYDLVLKNQLQTLKDLKEGANLKILSKMVDNDFKINGYNLVHALGHGVGLEIHESPFFSMYKDLLLKENMIVTNEPGIYIPNEFGIRIEDTVLITKSGCINLTESEKNYIILKE